MRTYVRFKPLLLIFLLVWFVAASGHAQVALEQEDYNYAYRLYNDGLYDLAAAQFLRFVESHPESPRAAECVYLAGRAFLQTNQLIKARNAFSRVVLEFPQSSYVDRSLFGLAAVYIRQKRPCSAAASLERVSILTPDSPKKGQALVKAAHWYSVCGRKRHAAQLLETVLHDFRGTSVADAAKLRLAALRLQTGRPDLAEKLLDQLKVGQTSDSLAAEANLLAGQLYAALLRYDKAQQRFLLVAEKAPNAVQRGQAVLRLAELELVQGHPSSALDLLSRLSGEALPDSLVWQIRILRAASAVCTGSPPHNLALFDGQPRSLPNSVRRQVLLARTLVARRMKDTTLFAESARSLWSAVQSDSTGLWPIAALKLWLQSGAPDAVRSAIAYAQTHPVLDSLSGLTVATARSLLSSRPCRARAEGLLTEFVLRFPQAPDADLAAFLLAQAELDVNPTKARLQLQSWFKQFPESELENRARALKDSLDLYVPTLGPSEAKLVLGLAARSTSATLGAAQYLEAANVALESLKDYRLASTLARQAAAAGARGAELRQALDVLGQSFLRLSQLAAAKGSVEESHQLADSARMVLELALQRTPGTDSCRLKRALAEAILAGSWDIPTKLDRLEVLSSDSSASCPAVQLAFSRALWEVSGFGEHDSTAVEALRRAVRVAGATEPEAEKASYLAVQIALGTKDTTSADSVSHTYLQRFTPANAHWARVVLVRARLLLARGQADEAARLLRKVVTNRSYADVSDTARVLWARAERLRGRPSLALKILRKVRNPWLPTYGADRLPAWSLCFDRQQTALRAEVKLEAAKAWLAKGNPVQALVTLKELRPSLASLPPPRQVAVLLLQAEATKKLGRTQEWLYALRTIWENKQLPLEARERAGFVLLDGLLQNRLHRKALGLAKALQSELPDPSRQARAAEAEIVCLYRLDQIKEARALAKRFAKDFKGVVDLNSAQARFAYEEGEYYFRQKRFDRAEKAYRRAVNRKNTKWARQAEFAIAKLYLTLNKTDKALNQLTDIPQKYPGTRVADLALLNLGVFYHQNKQLANAIFTLSKVVADSQRLEPATLQSAERELIRCYDEAGMWDRAIALSRDYLRRFPDAEDAFSRKVQIGVLLIKLNEYDRAIDYLRELKLEADPESQAEVQYWIGKAFLSKGDLETAISELLRVRYACPPTKLPWDVTAMFEAANAYMRLQRYDRAQKLFEQIVRLRGSNSNFGRSALQKIKEIQELRGT